MEKARELVSDNHFAHGFDVKSLRGLSEFAYMQDLREEHGRKYSTYFEDVKQGYSFEAYLDQVTHSPCMYTLVKFRLGAHYLAIETGAWQGKPRVERYCTFCATGEIEDEVHLIYNCPAYDDLRSQFDFIFNSLGEQNLKSFLDWQDKYAIGKFLHLCFALRKRLVQSSKDNSST